MQSHSFWLFAVCRVLFLVVFADCNLIFQAVCDAESFFGVVCGLQSLVFWWFLRSAISYFRLFAMQSHCFLVVCGLQSLIFWWFLRIAYKASFFGGFAVICLGHILLGSFWLDLCPRSDPTTFRLQQRP